MKSKDPSKKRVFSKIGIKGNNKKLIVTNSKIKISILLASEKTLARDWLTEREDKAWNNL